MSRTDSAVKLESESTTSAGSIVAGGLQFALAMVVANAGNFVLNLYLGRVLSPALFADATLIVTLLLTVSSIALCLQLVAARFVALLGSADADRVAALLRRWAIVAGVLIGVILSAGSPLWQTTFHTRSSWPFVILGAGIPFYLVQSVGRGVLQGRLSFGRLALSFVVEMVARLGLGILLVSLGWGVIGAAVGLSLSFVAAWIVVGRQRKADSKGFAGAAVSRYAASVSILLLGQIVANNSDVFLAKAFFTPTDAGLYSAVALVGRAVFFLAWSVATVIFPVVARRSASGATSRKVLWGGMVVVALIGCCCTIGALLCGGPVLSLVLGPAYAGLSPLIAAYAAMTTLFAIANLVASFRLSQGFTTESWMLLAGSLLQLALLAVWHATPWSLIVVQAVSMVVVLSALSVRAVVSFWSPLSLPTEVKAQ